MGAAGIGAFALLLWLTRDTIFMQDEWDFIQGRLDNDDDAFLQPHNNHLLLLVVLFYKGVWGTVGLDDYWVVRVLATLVHLTCVALLFEFSRRRVHAVAAFALCLPILVLGSAWEVLLVPFNIQWYLSVAAFLAILMLTERDGAMPDVGIAALVLVALASSSFGPPAALGVVVACVLQRRWRRLSLVAVPIALYALWFLIYDLGAENQPPTELTLSPVFLLHTAAGSVGGFFGLPLGVEVVATKEPLVTGVHVVTVALFAGLAFQLGTGRRPLTPVLAVILAALGAYWLVLMVTRGYTEYAYTSRYLYVSCVLLAALAAEHFRGSVASGRTVAAVLGVAVLAAGANVAVLRHYSHERRHNAMILSAELGALEVARRAAPRDFRPDQDPRRAVTIVAATYFSAIDRLDSSPAPRPEEVLRLPVFARRAADDVLERALGVDWIPSTPALQGLLDYGGRRDTRIAPDRVRAGTAEPRGRCLVMRPQGGGTAVAELDLPRFGLTFRGRGAGSVEAAVRRFAPDFASGSLTAPEGARESVVLGSLDADAGTLRARMRARQVTLVC